MPKKKKFEVRISVNVPRSLAEFLEDMVRVGHAETIAQAVRRCISVAKTYMPEVSVKAEEEK